MAAKTFKKPFSAPAAQVAEQSEPKLFRGYESLSALGQEHIAAVVQANTVLARGAETLGKELMGIAQANFANAASTAKAYFGAKTLQDVIRLNSDFAKSTLDSFLGNSARLSGITLQVANEAFAPLGQRVNATVEKVGKPLAA